MKPVIHLLLLATAAFLVPACHDDDDDDGDFGAAASTANVRFVHDSPDAPPVDIVVDGTTVAANVSYGAASDYMAVGAGTRNVEVRPAGMPTAVIDADVPLSADTDTTVVVTNVLASIEALVLTDDNSPPAAGQIKLRVVHGAPGAPAVDVYVTEPTADVNNATPVLTGVAFKGASPYLTVPAGTYRIRVTPAGTKSVVIDSGPVAIAEGAIRTVIARDAQGGGAPFGAILLADLN